MTAHTDRNMYIMLQCIT